MSMQTTPIAETNHFIVLDHYEAIDQSGQSYQTEDALEKELVEDLIRQGYEYVQNLNTPEKLLANVRVQLQKLNNAVFSDAEWRRFVLEYLDKPSENHTEKSRKIHDNYIHDFTFDDGRLQNIYLLDKKNIARNHLQVIRQFEQTGKHANRYDVTILVNGLPLIHIELKKRGVAIREAFNQVHRYSKESFNADNSLFKYVQIFVISNGTDTRYFANTTARNKNSFDFTMNWAQSNNATIKDLKDFTATFFQKNTLLRVLLQYAVFDSGDNLLILRPYQIAAAERILWKIQNCIQTQQWSRIESGGFIWHTTGSGKTLTSFKAARLATELAGVDKVFFVVDRKDLDYQTMKEYQRFSPDSVNGSASTAELKCNLVQDDNKIIVTTIQKLNNLMKSEESLPIYKKQVVFIFDECHRSQFGEAQRNLKRKFKKFCQFGFTGTPIFPENAAGAQTTASVFGRELHSYIITDAIRDEKVLKFKVDYNNVRPKFKQQENEQDQEKLSALETAQALLHPERIREIAQYILDNFSHKTHREYIGAKGFNAMLAVSSVEAAKLYYETFKDLQAGREKPLKIATIFSFAANENQEAVGDIADEGFEPSAMNSTAKEFLQSAIEDYNALFQSNYSVEGSSFQNYYRDLSLKVKKQEVDLLIVVGMFLTGFDAPTLNTLFVDKNLRYHGLIQAYSRTNRILNSTKSFGNIVTFRNLEQATIDAITLFGKQNTRQIILERSYLEYLNGYTDEQTGKVQRGYIEIVQELQQKFPSPTEIQTEEDKKEFVKLFGEYLRIENVLQNYDEFTACKAMQAVNFNDEAQVEAFKAQYRLDDKALAAMKTVPILNERKVQDYLSTYHDIRIQRGDGGTQKPSPSGVDWSDVVFEVVLSESLEINLDYILKLIFEHNKRLKNKEALIEEIRRCIRAGMEHRAKEGLIIEFIEQSNLDAIEDAPSLMAAFYEFAQKRQNQEAQVLIEENNLNAQAAKHYLSTSLKRQYASENGSDLKDILPKMSPLNPEYLTMKQRVFQKIADFVEKFKGIGGL